MVNLSKLNFFSGVNYLKRDSTTGSTSMALGAFGATTTFTVTHSLGYIPTYYVAYDASNDSTLWQGEKIGHYTETSLGATSPTDPQLLSWMTTTTLTLSLVNNTSPTATGSRTVYWVIYKDYGTS